MSVGIEFTPLQIQAYEDGATVFIFPIKNHSDYEFTDSGVYNEYNKSYHKGRSWSHSDFITDFSPVHHGDIDIFIKEEFFTNNPHSIYYKAKDYRKDGFNKIELWTSASQMTKEQSRYLFNKCISVKLVKLSDITRDDANNMLPKNIITLSHHNWYGNLLKEYNIDSTYELDIENNRYILLVEFER